MHARAKDQMNPSSDIDMDAITAPLQLLRLETGRMVTADGTLPAR